MSEDVNSIINDLFNDEQNLYGVALIGSDDQVKFQTENWDVTGDLANIIELVQNNPDLGQKGVQSISIQGVKYMVVENTEERKIGTNIRGQGHIIISPTGPKNAALVCYINPAAGPRDALFNIQEAAKKLVNKL